MNKSRVHEIIKEAVEIETEFICDALPCRLIGMNSQMMTQYIQFVADRLCIQLGYDNKGRTVEPVVKGNALETTINDQNEVMNNYSKMMEAAVNFPPLATVASIYLKMKIKRASLFYMFKKN